MTQSGADTHAGHSHGGGGAGHSHSHDGTSPPGMQPLLVSVPRPACGCGYADVEEMKRAAEAAALQPQLSAEEKTQRKVSAVHATREHGKQLYLEGKYAEAFAVYERGVLIASGIFNVGTGRGETFNDVARATINAIRRSRGEKSLSLDELRAAGAIEYVPFPQQLVGKYQSFTQADVSALRAAGYEAPFLTVEQGVTRYVDQRLASR